MPKTLPEWKEKEFEEFQKNKGTGVAEFSADWCGACKVTEPILAGLVKKHPDLKFFKINVNNSQKLASKMGVMSIPNIFFIKEGKIAGQIIGAASAEQFEEKIQKAF